MTRARDLIVGPVGIVAAAATLAVFAYAGRAETRERQAVPASQPPAQTQTMKKPATQKPSAQKPAPGTQASAAAPAAQPKTDPPLRNSTLFAWESLKPTETKVGSRRHVIRTSTETLDELESHITTLNPGVASHEPHTHANEEMIILKEGTLEAYVEGAWVPMSTGSMVFFASMHPHAVRNAGTTPATYYVVNWSPPGLLIRNPTGGK